MRSASDIGLGVASGPLVFKLSDNGIVDDGLVIIVVSSVIVDLS